MLTMFYCQHPRENRKISISILKSRLIRTWSKTSVRGSPTSGSGQNKWKTPQRPSIPSIVCKQQNAQLLTSNIECGIGQCSVLLLWLFLLQMSKLSINLRFFTRIKGFSIDRADTDISSRCIVVSTLDYVIIFSKKI